MVGKTNVGGGGSAVSTAWAYIAVTYPAGSTCTATNGTTTLNAQGTSGLYVFQIPEPTTTPETWTVSCTDGTKTKSVTAEISAQYSAAIVELKYRRLPEGYQEVEYLESNYASSGYPMIDTGIGPPKLTEQIEIDFMCPNDVKHSVMGYGNQSSNYSGSMYGGIGYLSSESYSSLNIACVWRSKSSNAGYDLLVYGLDATIGTKMSVILNDSNHNVLSNGVKKNSDSIPGDMMFNASTNIGLFSLNNYDTSSYPFYGGVTRIYKYIRSVPTTGEVVQNFVPCYRISDNKPGMYDLVSGTFFANAIPRGTFLVGPDV